MQSDAKKQHLTVCVCDCSPELCEVLEEEEAGSEAQASGPVQYQCLDCLALFDSPETWLEHRRTHSRSSTHSNTETLVRNQTLNTNVVFLSQFNKSAGAVL